MLAELKQQGLILHIGLSNISRTQFAEGRKITEIVCVQNFYNVAQRKDDDFIDELAKGRRRLCAVLPAGRIFSRCNPRR